MPILGKIQLFNLVYTHMYQMRDPASGKFSKTGKPSFDFVKERKTRNFANKGSYEVVKHSEMNPFAVKTGKAVSKLLYITKHPKTMYYAALSAMALVAGAGAYIISEDRIQESNDNLPIVREKKQDSTVHDSAAVLLPNEQDNTYVVQKDDNIWNINKKRIENTECTKPSNASIQALTDETKKLNPNLKDNGNLIYVGDTIILPDI